jgi:sugar-specific transcriptional regulator TrmB
MGNINQEILTTLKGIGLSKNEALVYLAALELGPSSIWEISLKSGVKRPTCYVILEDLAVLGYASNHNDGRRTIYSVLTPRQLALAVNRRHNKFISSLSELDALASKAPAKPNVRLFEGEEGVKQVYNMTLDLPSKSEILIYGTANVIVNYQDFIGQYLQNRVAHQISARVIMPESEYNRSITGRDAADLRQSRFLSSEYYNQQTEMNIFGECIAYIAHSEKEPFATLIENATLASEERMRFNLLWNIAKE